MRRLLAAGLAAAARSRAAKRSLLTLTLAVAPSVLGAASRPFDGRDTRQQLQVLG